MPIESRKTSSLTAQPRDGLALQTSRLAASTKQDGSTGEIVEKNSHAKQTTNSGRQVEEIGKNTPEFGRQRNGYTRNRDKRYDGGVKSVELSSPPATNVVHVSTICAQAVNATRELYIGYSLYERN